MHVVEVHINDYVELFQEFPIDNVESKLELLYTANSQNIFDFRCSKVKNA